VRGQETTILCAAVEHHGRDLVLDLAAVDAIDAAGIGLLVSLQAAGIYLKLVNPTKQVREVFRVTKLESIFEIREFQSVEAMTKSARAYETSGDFKAPLSPELSTSSRENRRA
jgi:anti-anti-sigma regulatory factor